MSVSQELIFLLHLIKPDCSHLNKKSISSSYKYGHNLINLRKDIENMINTNETMNTIGNVQKLLQLLKKYLKYLENFRQHIKNSDSEVTYLVNNSTNYIFVWNLNSNLKIESSSNNYPIQKRKQHYRIGFNNIQNEIMMINFLKSQLFFNIAYGQSPLTIYSNVEITEEGQYEKSFKGYKKTYETLMNYRKDLIQYNNSMLNKYMYILDYPILDLGFINAMLCFVIGLMQLMQYNTLALSTTMEEAYDISNQEFSNKNYEIIKQIKERTEYLYYCTICMNRSITLLKDSMYFNTFFFRFVWSVKNYINGLFFFYLARLFLRNTYMESRKEFFHHSANEREIDRIIIENIIHALHLSMFYTVISIKDKHNGSNKNTIIKEINFFLHKLFPKIKKIFLTCMSKMKFEVVLTDDEFFLFFSKLFYNSIHIPYYHTRVMIYYLTFKPQIKKNFTL